MLFPYSYFFGKVVLTGLIAVRGTFIMVSVCVMRKLHTENEVLVIMGGGDNWLVFLIALWRIFTDYSVEE